MVALFRLGFVAVFFFFCGPAILVMRFFERRKIWWVWLRVVLGMAGLAALAFLNDYSARKLAPSSFPPIHHIGMFLWNWGSLNAADRFLRWLTGYPAALSLCWYLLQSLMLVLPVMMIFGFGKRLGESQSRTRDNHQRDPALHVRLWRKYRPLEHVAGFVNLGWLMNGARRVSMGAERTMHTHIVGASGAGKTEALKRIIEADIKSGHPVIWIDGKGAEENAAWFASMALHYNRAKDLRLFMPSRKLGSYNPLRHGDATEVKDRLVSSFDWSEQYYKGRAQVILQAALRALLSQKRSFTMDDLAIALEPGRDGFSHLLARSTDAIANEHLAAFAKDKDWQQAVSKARDDLALFVSSTYGEMLTISRHALDFSDIYTHRQIAYVQLPVGLSTEFMRYLGKLMLSDLNSLNSAIATGGVPKVQGLCSIVIDEFGNFVTQQFITLLREARSQNFAITIAHQSLGDLRALTPEASDQIQGNTNTKIILQQPAHADADNWAKLIGTRHAVEQTYQTEKGLLGEGLSGRGSLRQTHQFIVEPDVIKNLKQGRAVFVRKQPQPFVGIVDIAQATPFKLRTNKDGKTLLDICQEEFSKETTPEATPWNLRNVKRAELGAGKKQRQVEAKPSPKPKARVQPDKSATAPQPIAPKATPGASSSAPQEPKSALPATDDEPTDARRGKRATSGLTHGGEW